MKTLTNLAKTSLVVGMISLALAGCKGFGSNSKSSQNLYRELCDRVDIELYDEKENLAKRFEKINISSIMERDYLFSIPPRPTELEFTDNNGNNHKFDGKYAYICTRKPSKQKHNF